MAAAGLQTNLESLSIEQESLSVFTYTYNDGDIFHFNSEKKVWKEKNISFLNADGIGVEF